MTMEIKAELTSTELLEPYRDAAALVMDGLHAVRCIGERNGKGMRMREGKMGKSSLLS